MEVLTWLDITSDLQPVKEYSDRVNFKGVITTYDCPMTAPSTHSI